MRCWNIVGQVMRVNWIMLCNAPWYCRANGIIEVPDLQLTFSETLKI